MSQSKKCIVCGIRFTHPNLRLILCSDPCRRERKRQYSLAFYRRNVEKRREERRQWYRSLSEEGRARYKKSASEWKSRNSKQHKENRRACYRALPEEKLEQIRREARERNKRNSERSRERSRQFYAEMKAARDLLKEMMRGNQKNDTRTVL
jgi:superfamily II DNA helicase RecQ